MGVLEVRATTSGVLVPADLLASGPELLETTERVIAAIGRPTRLTTIDLHRLLCLGVGQLRAGLEWSQVAALADEAVDAIGEHLLSIGQQPRRDLRRTVGGWLTSVDPSQIRAELHNAADFWRYELAHSRSSR